MERAGSTVKFAVHDIKRRSNGSGKTFSARRCCAASIASLSSGPRVLRSSQRPTARPTRARSAVGLRHDALPPRPTIVSSRIPRRQERLLYGLHASLIFSSKSFPAAWSAALQITRDLTECIHAALQEKLPPQLPCLASIGIVADRGYDAVVPSVVT